MDEQVLARLVRRNEAEALVVAEPLHGSSCHYLSSSVSAVYAEDAGGQRPTGTCTSYADSSSRPEPHPR